MITPAGVGREATWAGVRRGLSTAATDTELKVCPVDFSCRIPEMSPEQGRIGGGKDFLSRRVQELRPVIVNVVESAVDTMTAGAAPTSSRTSHSPSRPWSSA
ncbi:hypothetical protein ACFWBH_21340 [Streptomyces sp. NPDC059999]|uniref:hypothetical protein n=1 Tax=Streptomyces sp. NPDC059999 TaxID=3347030 RepID=UPI0036BECFCF